MATTLEKVERLLTYVFGEPYGDGMTVTNLMVGYAEPGYGSLAGDDVVVLGNWNPKRYPRDDDAPLTKEENLGPRLADVLERMGAEIEWLDEWYECDECHRAVRSQPDSYSWKPSFSATDDGIICHECLAGWGEDALEGYINEPGKAVTWADGATLESYGYERYNEYPYEHGWHPGQTDDPHVVLDEILTAKPDAQVVFLLDENSQFYLRFSAFIKTTEEKEDAE